MIKDGGCDLVTIGHKEGNWYLGLKFKVINCLIPGASDTFLNWWFKATVVVIEKKRMVHDDNISRSARLRKYGAVYELCLKRTGVTEKPSERRVRFSFARKKSPKRGSPTTRSPGKGLLRRRPRQTSTKSPKRKSPKPKSPKRKSPSPSRSRSTKKKPPLRGPRPTDIARQQSSTPHTRGVDRRIAGGETISSTPVKKTTMTEYQKFVQYESRDPRYAGLPAKERMGAIARKWRESKGI